MKIIASALEKINAPWIKDHQESMKFLTTQLNKKGLDIHALIQDIQQLQVAIPSWALGAGGTRFGRFSTGGEPANLYQKIADIHTIHQLTQASEAISLHIPWDIPDDPAAISQYAREHHILFDAVNSNTFQDQPGQPQSYKFGSLCHTDRHVREQAITHNIEVIRHGISLGSKSITVWLADGSAFPGQLNFRQALEHTLDSLQQIYQHLPADWKMFIEYKPYEPNFYSTVIQDWGTSFLLAQHCGPQAYSLVDLGHHLPNTNIEQIVATLMWQGKLGGFHFNDSKYGDDDLTVGSIKPYQLFLIFNELVYVLKNNRTQNPVPAWMIDASHNLKDPLEDLMQSLEAIRIAYAQALIINHLDLEDAREANDVTRAQDILQDAYRTDVRPLIREARLQAGGAADPIAAYRAMNIRAQLISERGQSVKATGL